MIYSEDEKQLWAAVLATAVDDASRHRHSTSTKAYASKRDYLNKGDKTGYALPTKEAALNWMRDGLKDQRAGSFNWICQMLSLNAAAILKRVEETPEKISPRAMNHLRGNPRKGTRRGKAMNFGTT